MADNPSNKRPPIAGEADAEEAKKRLSLADQVLGGIKNFFKRLFGRKEASASEANKDTGKKPPTQTQLLGAWDDLSDQGDSLNQKLQNTLADLEKQKPKPPEGNDPAAWEDFKQQMMSHQQAVSKEGEAYNVAAAVLQVKRDGLLNLAKQHDLPAPDEPDLDLKLGASGYGPGNGLVSKAILDSNDEIGLANQKIQELEKQVPSMEEPAGVTQPLSEAAEVVGAETPSPADDRNKMESDFREFLGTLSNSDTDPNAPEDSLYVRGAQLDFENPGFEGGEARLRLDDFAVDNPFASDEELAAAQAEQSAIEQDLTERFNAFRIEKRGPEVMLAKAASLDEKQPDTPTQSSPMQMGM